MNDVALSPGGDLLRRSPYARFLGVRTQLRDDGLIGMLPFSDRLIGNPILPALHGGVVAAFLELTALAQLAERTGSANPRTVNITVDYLRSARAVDSFARAEILRVGRRVANLRVTAWQADERQPVATLRGHFLIKANS